MGIFGKINVLLFASVIALVVSSIIVNILKSRELEYYALTEQIRTLQIHATDALAQERNFERTFSGSNLVYEALEIAVVCLDKIQTEQLEESAYKIPKISQLLTLFRNSFTKMVGNTNELLKKRAQINELANSFSAVNDEINSRINEQISAGLLGFKELDTDLLQILKNDSLGAFTSINRIVLSINQDLILDGDINKFHSNYERAIMDLENQQTVISVSVSSLKNKLYHFCPVKRSTRLTGYYHELNTIHCSEVPGVP